MTFNGIFYEDAMKMRLQCKSMLDVNGNFNIYRYQQCRPMFTIFDCISDLNFFGLKKTVYACVPELLTNDFDF